MAGVKLPNGKSVAEAQMRVVKGFAEPGRLYDPDDQIVCVAHNEILRLAIAGAIHQILDDFHRLTIDPASMSIMDWRQEYQKLRLLNYSP